MTTFATDQTDHDTDLDPHLDPRLDARLDAHWGAGLLPGFAYDDRLTGSVANPRRTTWTGYGRTEPDRRPAT